jgi:hypothetical protein
MLKARKRIRKTKRLSMERDSSMAYPARYWIVLSLPMVRKRKRAKASAAATQRMVAAIEVE